MKESKIYLERIKRLQKVLKNEKLDLFFIKNSKDLFYFTGIEMSLGYLYIYPEKECLFVDGRYLEMATKHSPVPVTLLSSENQVKFLKGAKTVGFEGSKLSYASFMELRKLCQLAKAKPIEKTLVNQLRLIKDEFEIRLMKKSAEFIYKAYQFLCKKLKVGITEIELVRELKIYCLKHGVNEMSFEPIISFGKNTSLPHYHSKEVRLKKNDIVLLDLGVVLDGYCSDMTRVEFVGRPDPQLKKIYEINRAAQKMALSHCRPGVRLKELDMAARKVMAKEGLEEYFIHGLGHGIGLEVHEPPRIKKEGSDRNLILEPGMAITIEPGIYLPGKGGVRYEDTIVITSNGYTNFYPEK